VDARANIAVMLRIFAAVEQRDETTERELYQPDVELCWPPSLP
jgi:hypothetical protein